MRRAWTLAAFAIAVIAVGVVVACDANGTKDVLRSAAVSTAIAQEQGGAKGCSLIGSWSTDAFGGENVPIQWMATVTGQSNSSGELVVETPVWPFLQWNTTVNMRGAWKRTGGNTFEFLQIGWVRAPDGTPLWLARNFGTQTLSNDCTTMTVTSTMVMMPLVEAVQQIGPAPLNGLVAYRIVVP